MPENDDEVLFRPSALPNKRAYERAKAEVNNLFTPSDPPTDPGAREYAKTEQEKFDKARLNAKTQVVEMTPELLRNYKDRLKDEIDARQVYGVAVFALVIVWLAVATLFLWATGSERISLDVPVLVALTAGATVSIIGLLGTIVTYFFTKSSEQTSLYKELFKAMLDEEKNK